ncbi:MAG: hypothetical protein SFT68_04890, partial [Rickettsiaceae bacterium]|nr:hypothetical protein [Rickettsiaceae bacterium]
MKFIYTIDNEILKQIQDGDNHYHDKRSDYNQGKIAPSSPQDIQRCNLQVFNGDEYTHLSFSQDDSGSD